MRLNLHQKILLGAILPSAVVLTLFCLLSLLGLRQEDDHARRETIRLEAERLAVTLGASLRQAEREAAWVAQLGRLPLPPERLAASLRSLLADAGGIAAAGLRYADPARPEVRVARNGGAPPDGDTGWFHRAAGGAAWTPPVPAGDGRGWLTSYVLPFPPGDGPVGAARIDLRLDSLPALAVSAASSDATHLLLIDASGRVLHGPRSALAGRPYTDFAPAGSARAAFIAERLRQSGSAGVVLDWPPLGRSYVGAARVVPGDWLLLQARPASQLLPALGAGHWLLAGLLVLAMLLLVAFWYRLVRRYTRPLGQLAHGVERLAQGEPLPPADYREEDELGRLAAGIDRLVQDLHQRDRSAQARQRDLADRVREQHVLYRVADILGWVDADFAEMLRRVTLLLPEAWAQADGVCARVNLGSHRCVTEGFRESERGLFAPIDADGTTVGGVWIFALEAGIQREASHQELLEGVAQQLGLAYRRERAQSQLEEMNHALERHVEARTQALRQAERLLRDITNSLPGAVYQIHRPDARPSSLRFVSAGVEELFGVSREQALANFDAVLDRVHPDDYSGLMAAVSDAVINDATFTHVYRITAPGGELRWVRSSANVFREDDGYLLNGYWIDVTGQKRMELALEQSRREADAANVAKGRFLANMSHEIRTPMNAIIGLTHLAHGHTTEPKVREQLGKVEDAAQNLLGLLNDILDFSKIEAGRMGLERIPFDLWQVLDRVEGLMADIRGFLNTFRTSMSAETISRFESDNSPGSLRWLEEHLIDGLLKGFQTAGGVATDEVFTLEKLGRQVNDIFVELTKDHGNYATPRGPRGDLSGTNHLSRGPIFRANVYHLVRRPLTTGRPRGRR